MGLGQRQQQLEARLALPALQARQRALGDPGLRGQRRQRHAAPFSQPPQPRTDLGQHVRDRRRVAHGATLPAVPGNGNEACDPRRRRARWSAWNTETYDVAIIGGGPAGLSAALVLGRARRRVVVIDAGTPRNAPAAHMQGFLSRDGTPPAELLRAARAEVRRYGVEIVDDRVVDATAGFALRLAGGRTVQARQVLLATGAADELPDVAGARERWGRDFLHCPYCHGWEVRDQPIGVLGSVEHAHLLRQWTDDVILFTHTTAVTADERATLARPRHRGRRRDRRAPRRQRRPPARRAARRRSHRRRATRSSSDPRCARTPTGPPPPSAASCSPADSSAPTPTAAPACPASGRPATPPTRARR